jgi:hypothetical protein
MIMNLQTKIADMLYRESAVKVNTITFSADRYSVWNKEKTTLFSGHYLRNRSTLDIGVLGYICIF